ncbi:hypothetical protein SL053_002318 [Flavobacterium psychrophilum]|nr:hypothetical protein [Flavobacterium psychrophilum]
MKKMKLTVTVIFMLLLSCKGNITNIKLTPIENDKKWDFYYINSKENADYKKPVDSVFVCKPISFRLENNTGDDIKINVIIDNFLGGRDAVVIVNNKNYENGLGSIKINSKKTIDITMFTHLPIPVSILDKEYLDRIPITGNKIKRDSIVLTSISPKLQSAVESSFKSKIITIFLVNKNSPEEEAWLSYCAYRQKTFVFDSDSLSKVNPRYKPDCN